MVGSNVAVGFIDYQLCGTDVCSVSLAITLLHKPPLLILDEPTVYCKPRVFSLSLISSQVGVDPVLRAKLWHHMRELVTNDGVSILITTHYIEEARCVDKLLVSHFQQESVFQTS